MQKKLKKRYIIFLPIIFVLIAIYLIKFFNLDLKIAHLFYFGAEKKWFLADKEPWKSLYKYGNLPAITIAAISLILAILSYFKKFCSLKKIRALASYLYILMILGPGLLVNAVFKENWGRPRPREILPFGGQYNFEPVLTIDLTSPGNSFSCGHCSVAFYYFSGFFIFWLISKKISWAFFIFAICYGTIMGIARMAAGGHFLSDIVWSGFILFICAGLLYYPFKLWKIN